jgi:hypothetical protein
LKYKITGFTEEEIEDIDVRYHEWSLERNIEWVEKEFYKVVEAHPNGDKINLEVDDYDFVNNYAERMYVFEKLKDCHMHKSPYVDGRIGEYEIESFNHEIGQRITLEEIEQNFKTDFIEKKIKDKSFDSFQEELLYRQKLKDCEMHTTPYVEKRIQDFPISIHNRSSTDVQSLDEELTHRIKYHHHHRNLSTD